ncbi:hypothetical protein VNO78_10800 [Psophocarpus tetragonolobus]|uniref:Uncharacterized protein n=1 Tax=Psophocarpus tetragonolobus TaxID=3891 RepID=A0AAN9SMR4_PSOTE
MGGVGSRNYNLMRFCLSEYGNGRGVPREWSDRWWERNEGNFIWKGDDKWRHGDIERLIKAEARVGLFHGQHYGELEQYASIKCTKGVRYVVVFIFLAFMSRLRLGNYGGRMMDAGGDAVVGNGAWVVVVKIGARFIDKIGGGSDLVTPKGVGLHEGVELDELSKVDRKKIEQMQELTSFSMMFSSSWIIALEVCPMDLRVRSWGSVIVEVFATHTTREKDQVQQDVGDAEKEMINLDMDVAKGEVSSRSMGVGRNQEMGDNWGPIYMSSSHGQGKNFWDAELKIVKFELAKAFNGFKVRIEQAKVISLGVNFLASNPFKVVKDETIVDEE